MRILILSDSFSEMVLMPAMSNVAVWIRALPHWSRVAVQDLAAGAMAHLLSQNQAHMGSNTATQATTKHLLDGKDETCKQ